MLALGARYGQSPPHFFTDGLLLLGKDYPTSLFLTQLLARGLTSEHLRKLL